MPIKEYRFASKKDNFPHLLQGYPITYLPLHIRDTFFSMAGGYWRPSGQNSWPTCH